MIGRPLLRTLLLARREFGGWGVLENPALDAREAQPSWHPDPPSIVHITPAYGGSRTQAFSLWSLSGRKSILHDGRRLLLTGQVGRERIRAALWDGIEDGQPFAFVIPAGAGAHAGMKAASRFMASVVLRNRRIQRSTAARPSRAALFHARALQALDGSLAGASRREIAHVLFGPERVARSWQPGSDLRSHIRHLVQRATAFMNGEYRALLSLRLPARKR